jgi:hypothetical protein
MLFVATLNPTGGTPQERTARRLKWDYPEGVKPIAEYWPLGGAVSVISIFEADSVAPILATLMAWGDVFEISVSPAVTAEEGMRLAQQMMGG